MVTQLDFNRQVLEVLRAIIIFHTTNPYAVEMMNEARMMQEALEDQARGH